jgi:hypothetical protein
MKRIPLVKRLPIRALILSLIPLAVTSCATVDVQMSGDCRMGIPMNSSGISADGDIRLKWRLVRKDDLPGYCGGKTGNYGCAYVNPGFTQIYMSESLEFSEVCKLARLGHEVAHAMYADH